MKLVLPDGIEPSASRLPSGCTAIVLRQHGGRRRTRNVAPVGPHSLAGRLGTLPIQRPMIWRRDEGSNPHPLQMPAGSSRVAGHSAGLSVKLAGSRVVETHALSGTISLRTSARDPHGLTAHGWRMAAVSICTPLRAPPAFQAGPGALPVDHPNWYAREDSNLQPPPSQGGTSADWATRALVGPARLALAKARLLRPQGVLIPYEPTVPE